MTSYSLLDFGNSQRLEQWSSFRLIRPDATAESVPARPELWKKVDAVYEGEKGKGQWIKHSEIPEEWVTEFGDIKMLTRLAPYKHTGVFPEQEQNWQWIREQARASCRKINVLHLFAYTGGATMALALDGHSVTHVDASKPAINWAKENTTLNAVPGDRIRWILEDAAVFVAREIKRGKTYDAVILDPPAYGHSPSGKTWRIERDLSPLLEDCAALLSDQASFILLNGYAQHDTPESFHRLLTGVLRSKTHYSDFHIDAKELFLRSENGSSLSTGIVARCQFS